ncbi:30S ribosomal protein S7 [Natronomonas moolapensis 8.8.11]|uniref:Small ribosomal subunit protein uS7 n=1 Tax=Natronomonas moolapensis (strain DSM 18674 / CECT 7526 / JCM 14361 / 8.8.11) TaxID=268739 RepID=M1Y5V2_NATM8|nr:30S ribosomal protein S7 [Natronomonas moolapensis]CCQ37950.1 30S ribosomal protein S7 [Natronomonas moolapensis 8.8.11]
MSSDAPEPEAPASTDDERVSAKLFGEYEIDGIEYADPSTRRYITVTPIAHTMGRHSEKQFKKSEISVVERLINRLMQTDENTGKKQQATRIVRDAFDLVEERTDENPIQVLVTAVENAGPREETVRLKYGGISVPKAVDVAPQRRVDQSLKYIAQGTHNGSFKTTTSAAEALANQLIGASNYDLQAYPVSQKEEQERVAAAAR